MNHPVFAILVIERFADPIVSPLVGGLHHRYERRAA
jgi:hypothetical protein